MEDDLKKNKKNRTTYFFFFSISSSWVNIRLHTENQLYTLPGSALKVCVGGWWVGGGVESEFSDQLWLWPSRTITV